MKRKDDWLVKMSKWRHDVLEAVDSHEVDPRTWIPRPTRFHGFQFCRRWSLATFFPQHFFTVSLPLLSIVPLPSRFLSYPRFFNSHAWARMDREGPFGPSSRLQTRWSCLFLPTAVAARAPKARAFKRYNRVALWKLMHSIVDLCTIHVEYIGTHFVYEINFVHAPLASRSCNYQ